MNVGEVEKGSITDKAQGTVGDILVEVPTHFGHNHGHPRMH